MIAFFFEEETATLLVRFSHFRDVLRLHSSIHLPSRTRVRDDVVLGAKVSRATPSDAQILANLWLKSVPSERAHQSPARRWITRVCAII